MVFRKKDALRLEKRGVDMWVYTGAEDCPQASVVYQETPSGHAEEFYHEKSAFIFYILEGSGVWVIEDREYPVKASDVVVVPPGKRFFYRGNLKQVCLTAPAWEERFEHHVRDVEL
jgi:mannose-6-phosphate isomerase-like protein (cupin superfamily)